AYAFQGDERDVMFLSMVAAPNERIGALTKESDKQRFNVAASRARDQVWLFHTATLNELNHGCMRHKLLGYYSNPAAHSVGKPDWDKCESNFEREVGKLIYAKNYRVIPQYEPFGPRSYRIDFVIEGLKSRLAVECDGPHHDDPEQIERDMARQRPPVAHAVVAQLKRSRTDGCFTGEDICKVVLTFLEADRLRGRKELVADVVKALDLPKHDDKRVENVLEALKHAGNISLGV